MRRLIVVLIAGLSLIGCATKPDRGIAQERKSFYWPEPKGWDNRSFEFPRYLSSEMARHWCYSFALKHFGVASKIVTSPCSRFRQSQTAIPFGLRWII